MQIKSIRIDRYGPLGDFKEENLPPFTLIHGPNERGKTLLIDAILKLLFKKELGRRVKDFGNMDRVAEEPEGYIVLAMDGKERKLGRNETIRKFVPITPADFRNTFVVRDGDLSILDEKQYYTDVSEKLTGLRTSEIESIKKIIQQKGRLTNPSSSADLSNSAAAGHVAFKVDSARRWIGEIQAIREDFQKKNFDRLERELVETRERGAVVEREISVFKKAEVRERYEKAAEQLEQYKQVLEALRSLEGFNDEDFEKWQRFEQDVNRIAEELELANREYVEKEKALADLKKEHAALRAKLDELEMRDRRFVEIVKPKLEEYEKCRDFEVNRRVRAPFWKWGVGISTALLAIALVGCIVEPSPFFYGSAALFFAAFTACAGALFKVKSSRGALEAAIQSIRTHAANFGVHAKKVEDILQAKQKLDVELEKARRDFREREVERGFKASELVKMSDHMRRQREKLHELRGLIEALKLGSGIDRFEEYRAALIARREKLTEKGSIEAVLTHAVGAPGGEEKLSSWESEIARQLAAEKDGDASIPYDPTRQMSLEKELGELKKRSGEIDETLRAGQSELQYLQLDIEKAGVLGGERVVCRTTKELEQLAARLTALIETIEAEKENAKWALALFEEIEAEEKAKVLELFGAERAVSRYFSKITGGMYEEVGFNPETYEIAVKQRSGEFVAARCLSGGAFDQLYLAIRLSIGEKIFKDRRGFFLLDDPFVRADGGRLRSQLGMLRDLTASGWQVLYFSAKQEVMDALGEDIAAGRVRLVQFGERVPEDGPRATDAMPGFLF